MKKTPMPERSPIYLAHLLRTAVVALTCTVVVPTFAASLLTPGDRTLAIDEDVGVTSGYFENEGPDKAIDGDPNTKYLNFAGPNSGFIVTPLFQASAQSIRFTTANDAQDRDPVGWAIYGTTDPITSTNNSAGTNENWVLIAEGTAALTDDRLVVGTAIPFDNWELYDSYRIIFTSTKGSSLMQVGDVQLFDDFGSPILAAGQPVVAIQLPKSQSRYPGGESPARAIDGVASTKYLNYGRENSGFIVTPSVGPSVLQSFTVITANDAEGRDPSTYDLYGSNDPILSKDNSTGQAESWTLISSGTLNLPAERLTNGPVITLSNTAQYRSYKLIFRDNKGPDEGNVDSIQIGDVAFQGIVAPQGSSLLRSSDRIIAIDRDLTVRSSYPDGEAPIYALDANPSTKYLNGGGQLTGFIVTPVAGASAVRSFRVTTANDAPERDPSMWSLYGTMDQVTSLANSGGTNENWTLVASGTVTLPDDRGVAGPVVAVANDVSFTSYKLIFTQLKSASSTLMQIADIQFYSTADATDPGFLSQADTIVATALLQPESRYPGGEPPSRVLDGDVNTKYLNFGRYNTGFIVVPSAGPTIVRNISLVTANDDPRRDPVSFELFGTRDAVTSPDNSQGTNESWTLIASGPLNLPDTRLTTSDPVVINNTTAFSAYKVVFPDLKSTNANSMQVAEVRLQGSIVRVLDVIPGNVSVTVQWESSSGASYTILYSEDLVTWLPLATNVAGDDRTTTRTFANPVPGTKTLFLKVGQP